MLRDIFHFKISNKSIVKHVKESLKKIFFAKKKHSFLYHVESSVYRACHLIDVFLIK